MVRFTLLLTSVHFSSMQIFHTAPDPSIPLPQPQSRSGSRRTRAICLSTGSRKPRGRYTPCLAEPDSKCISPREILSPLIQLYHTFVVIGQKQTFLWMLSPQHLPPPFTYSLSRQLEGTLGQQIHYYYKGKKIVCSVPFFPVTVMKYIGYCFVAGFVLLSKCERRKQEKVWLRQSLSFFLSHYVLKASSLGCQSAWKREKK